MSSQYFVLDEEIVDKLGNKEYKGSKEISRVLDDLLSSFGGGGTKCWWCILSFILLQVRVYFSISKFIRPPPSCTPSNYLRHLKKKSRVIYLKLIVQDY